MTKNNPVKIFRLLLLIILPMVISIFIYREAIFGSKVVFPTNYMVHLYAPWSTTRFSGWEAGVPNKPIGLDQIRFFYPLRTFSNSEIFQGRLPLWNQREFSGYPQLANLQSAIFYPFNAIYLILPQIVAWSILIIMLPVISSIFTYLYLRSIKLSYWPSLFGGTVFGFSGFMTVWTQENAVVGQTALWLPLILLSIEKIIGGKKNYLVVLPISIASMIFAGHFQTFFYAFFFLIPYVFYRLILSKKKKLTNIILIGASISFGVTLASIQLIPAFEILQQSVRSITTSQSLLNSYLLPVSYLLHILAPDLTGNPGTYNFFGRGFYHETALYVGIIPIIFSGTAIFNWEKKKYSFFYILFLLTTFFLVFDSNSTRWIYSHLPIINTFLPTRIFFLSTFILAILSAIGMEGYLRSSHKKIVFIISAIFILFMIQLLLKKINISLDNYKNIIALVKSGTVEEKNTILPLLSLASSIGIFVFIFKRRLFIALVFLLTIFNLFYFFNKYLSIGEKQFLFPEQEVVTHLKKKAVDHSRFISVGDPAIFEDLSSQFGLYSVEGLDPLSPVKYAKLVGAVKNHGKIATDISRVESTFHELPQDEAMTKNINRLKLMQILGVKSVVYFQGTKTDKDLSLIFPDNLFKKEWQGKGWVAFDFPSSLSRPYLVNKYIVAKNEQEILDKMFDKNIDLSKTVILEENIPNFETIENQTLQEVKLLKYSSQEVISEVNSAQNSILVLTDNYYPGWKAYIDGKESKIYRANFTFRAVVTPKGKHIITFKYEPLSFYLGALISTISLVILGSIYVLIKKTNH